MVELHGVVPVGCGDASEATSMSGKFNLFVEIETSPAQVSAVRDMAIRRIEAVVKTMKAEGIPVGTFRVRRVAEPSAAISDLPPELLSPAGPLGHSHQ
jgi:hypothetical protein